MSDIEDSKEIKKEVIKKIVVISILIICIVIVSLAINFLDELIDEPEYTEYNFELGDAIVYYNHETLKVEINGEGTYEISKVYLKTNNSEHCSGYNLGEAPLDVRLNSVNIADDYLNREVLYLKLTRLDTNQSEYVEVIG